MVHPGMSRTAKQLNSWGRIRGRCCEGGALAKLQKSVARTDGKITAEITKKKCWSRPFRAGGDARKIAKIRRLGGWRNRGCAKCKGEMLAKTKTFARTEICVGHGRPVQREMLAKLQNEWADGETVAGGR